MQTAGKFVRLNTISSVLMVFAVFFRSLTEEICVLVALVTINSDNNCFVFKAADTLKPVHGNATFL
jgi:hypothetical protein